MSSPELIRFAAVRGHERVRDFLRAAVAQDRLPHALLFVGPDGVGKRCLALALVAWLQCEQGGEDACGTCASCRRLAAGSHSDVQLVTVAAGKKEIGIDRIREVKRFMQLRSVGGKFKVAIVDDAHVLTTAAQNALLKVLEEPPSRAFLILISSRPDALLTTVRSRCQRIQFGPLAMEVVRELLTASADVDAARAEELATLSEGSIGRAQTLLACLPAHGREFWRQRLAGARDARYVRLARTAQELNAPESQVLVKLELLLSELRDAAVQCVRGDRDEWEGSGELAAILKRADAVDAACHRIQRGNPNRQLLLEALLLRLAES